MGQGGHRLVAPHSALIKKEANSKIINMAFLRTLKEIGRRQTVTFAG